MKLLLCFLLAGCTHTTVYQNGKPILRTSGDLVDYEAQGDHVRIGRIDHSTPNKAVAGTITAAGSAVAATGLATLIK